jgi:sugar lactone lactonase YvrE
MPSSRTLTLGTALLAMIAVLGFSACAVEDAQSGDSPAMEAAAEQEGSIPNFEVDPFWPQPLPNHWIMGSVVGVGVDSRDHVFVVHRQASLNARTEARADSDPPTGECCSAAPPVLEFDPDGNLVNAWGGPSDAYDWPASNHGLSIDHLDNIWIGGNGAGDSHILKFTRDGEFIMQMGEPGRDANSSALDHFGRVAKISFDPEANEAYAADGYGNKRVAVIDMDTGEIKRFWGAYGNEPSDENLGPYDPSAEPAQQFRNPVHCADPSADGLVYVCDRPNDRIQVFQRDGTFVDEIMLAPETLGDGSTWDVAFSRDAEQRFMYVADGKNERIYILDRAELELLAWFGDGGRQPGQFFAVHSIATDSRGNLYTTETYEGKRLQKFVLTGMRSGSGNLGVPWPSGN